MQETHYDDGRFTREFLKESELKDRMMQQAEKMEGVKSVRFAKVGRNDPCPCGSGRKFKRCCIAPIYAAPSHDAAQGQGKDGGGQ